MIAAVTTPDVWTVGRKYAAKHLTALVAFAEAGGYVRIIDVRQPSHAVWLGGQPPPFWTAELDDTALLETARFRQLSEARWGREEVTA